MILFYLIFKFKFIKTFSYVISFVEKRDQGLMLQMTLSLWMGSFCFTSKSHLWQNDFHEIVERKFVVDLGASQKEIKNSS